ncbi:MAG: hypothetical protein AAGF12_26325 [Myxococcota bacterium]
MRDTASLLPLIVCLFACGGPQVDRGVQLQELRQAIERPVSSPEESGENSRVVEASLEAEVLMEMTRLEVEEAIGRGDPCSRHPRCAEQEFESDDWFYTVGQMGEGRTGALPILIVGFDRTGRVTRVWNLRTH